MTFPAQPGYPPPGFGAPGAVQTTTTAPGFGAPPAYGGTPGAYPVAPVPGAYHGAPAAAPGFGAPPAAAPPMAGGFTRAPAAAPVMARPPTTHQSIWKGVQSADGRDPMLLVGDYVVRITENDLGENPNTQDRSFKGHYEVVWAADGSGSRVGESAAFIQKLTGKSGNYGRSRTKSYVVASAGYPDDASFDAFDPEGEFIDAVVGASNKYLQAFPNTIKGRLVRVRVSKGNDVTDNGQPTGDYYREYSWSPIPEDQQAAHGGAPMPRFA